MEIDSSEEAKELCSKSKNLINKLKNDESLSSVEKEDLLLILAKAHYEFFEASQE